MVSKSSKIQKSSILLEKELRPRTENQKEFIRSVCENTLTFAVGTPGGGKTFLSAGMAAKYLSDGLVDKIVLSRPIVNCGDGVGWLKGTLEEKTNIYFYPILDCMEFFLGKEQVRVLLQNKTIQLVPLEFMRGMSIRDTFLILDEASNGSMSQLKMLLSRLDHGSKFVINGDYKQTDLHHCDFRDVINKLQYPVIEDMGFIEFNAGDCQRHKLVNKMMERLE